MNAATAADREERETVARSVLLAGPSFKTPNRSPSTAGVRAVPPACTPANTLRSPSSVAARFVQDQRRGYHPFLITGSHDPFDYIIVQVGRRK